jgi:DNA-binding winged helix-turn-helix (wHTH) protein
MRTYIINDNIKILPEKNLVNDVKLEPRVMKLLCLLMERKGETVTREEIIKKIWEGYGGGDEGLTQAISFIRKILNDSDKIIIETIPKIGYVLNADVREETVQKHHSYNHPVKSKKYHKPFFMLLIVLVLIVTILFFVKKEKTDSLAPIAPVDTTPTKTLAPKAP